MRTILVVFAIMVSALNLLAQNDLQKLIDTERAFAATAAEKGTKTAFLEFTAPDGLLFLPDRIKAIDYWNARGASQGFLSWAPNYADISSNGLIGYTTGNWEYRAKEKDDRPAAFGEFVTVWQRMPDGKYKFVLDIGIGHDRPAKYSTEVIAPSYPSVPNEKNSSAADTANSFFETARMNGLVQAYSRFAAEAIRGYREGSFPLIGRKALMSEAKKRKSNINFTKRSVFFGSADIAYITNTYTETKSDGTLEKGNFLQIWKLVDRHWKIVLDIFKPVPQKKN